MADIKQLVILQKGAVAWNAWRVKHRPKEHSRNINYSKVDIFKINLSGIDLSRAGLSGADLSGADLSEATLRKSRLFKANLFNADLSNANLWEANCTRAILINANLIGADLSWANFSWASLDGANISSLYPLRLYIFTGIIVATGLSFIYLHTTTFLYFIIIGYVFTGIILRIFKIDGHSGIISSNHLTKTSFSKFIFNHLKHTTLDHANLANAGTEGIFYNRFSRYKNICIDSFNINHIFKQFVLDQSYIEEFRSQFHFSYFIWLIFSDCGRSMILWSLWIILFVHVFANKFFTIGKSAFNIATNLNWDMDTLYYYSVITISTLGFGDITPITPEAKHWVMAEVIIGYIMLGGLISIFANKLARRS